MSRYQNYDDPSYGEREPLDNNYHRSPSRSPARNMNDPYSDPYHQSQQQQHYAPQGYHYEQPHPESNFEQLRAERQYNRDHAQTQTQSHGQGQDRYAPDQHHHQQQHHHEPNAYDRHAPYPPAHGTHGNWGVTPGADNFGNTAAGGMAGIAYNVADQNARQSGVDAMNTGYPSAPQPSLAQPGPPAGGYYQQQRPAPLDRDSHSSLTPLGAAAVAPGQGTPSRSPLGYGAHDPYSDDPYQGYSTSHHNLGVVNPHDIADDGDGGLGYPPPQRNSMLSLSHSDRGSSVAGGAAAAGGVAGAVGGGLAARSAGSASGSGYGPVLGNGGGRGGAAYDGEKSSDWMKEQGQGKKKWKWVIIIVAIVVIIGAILGGTLGAILPRQGGGGSSSGGSSGSGQSADDDKKENGLLNKNSKEIKDLQDSTNLHKVFSGFDYTPLGVQYPECLHDPPSANNVTRDMAVLSQLTNTIRLYGNDCNQTELVLDSFKQLEIDNTMRLWLGVWLDKNASTNARQLAEFWNIMDTYGDKPFEGVIVGNEVLFREDMSLTELGNVLTEVRENMTTKGFSLPVVTSDLGRDWDAQLASVSDGVLANIHPLFGGVQPTDAASWSWNFWTQSVGPVFKTNKKLNIVSEIGWPSEGGVGCGDQTTTCTNGAKASIEGINDLLDDWVCPSIANTTYFWFSAFDEPWKARFDTPGKEWESKWGLFDVNRNLKKGIKIPDCGGKTID
ncbi:endo-beta-1,3-glucanase [Verticillium alfalfae VaMs.102]|uniref:glucan endo-1,3-beta-D-glucosidase n=1 Tax=Verticillium alfalfae (strain VaMs.102 / ATCC MYA-4576 / FGSC 10136) TaxID=526221 RepID=C9SBM3_VERA1|nr:endo-beta-1,3-glucanase [Verticillium alfalfae VaMs.102]EEY15757.1 endo-beta-1,3-glucanase [Verticillium alfalfae VaMs.102]